MTITNGYVTLEDFKAYITAAGQTIAPNTADDDVISNLIEACSRVLDDETGRTFYPRVETRYYNTPSDDDLLLDDDLLSVITITNGDAVVVSSSDYNLLPMNAYPKFCIRLKASASTFWDVDSNSNSEGVISVLGMWGYHNRYNTAAWKAMSTLSAGINAAVTTIPTTAATMFPGQIIKIDNELMIVSSITLPTSFDVTKRGENGSTAAAHLITVPVYAWRPQYDIWQACMEIVNNAYHRRFGENISGTATTTPAGLVIAPRDMTETARLAIARNRRLI